MPAGVFGRSEVARDESSGGGRRGQFPEALIPLETPGSRRYFQRKVESEGKTIRQELCF